MSGTEKPSYKIAYEPLEKVERPSALFRFDFEAAELIADNTFADHANYHQQGIALHLYRTATGRWVWRIETMFMGDYNRYESAMDSEGQPYNQSEVEHFIQRFGCRADLEQWRQDIGKPLPIA